MTEQEISKIRNKIPKWFRNPEQINTKILVSFMQLSCKNTKPVYIDELQTDCANIYTFDTNYNQMKIIAERNHAKVFDEDYNGMISLWQPVADFICEEYDKYLSLHNTTKTNDKGETMPPIEPNNPFNKIPPLNQILYGPPGTGKTYSTIDRALEILHHYDESIEILESREDKKAIFEKYKEQGQIAFVTFHQSFSYEEFVEGIKPKLIDSSEGLESSEMGYEIKSGIFKQLCDRAKQNTKEFMTNQQIAKSYVLDKNKTLWRLYTIPAGDVELDYFDECIDKNYIKAWEKYDGKRLGEAKEGDYIVMPSTYYGKMSKTIRAFGVLGGDITTKEQKEQGEYCRNVEWLWVAENENQIIEFDKVNFSRTTFQKVWKGKENIIDYMNNLLNIDKAIFETYILIIDEINRGNIAKILGELITLIESSKRIGASDEEKARGIGNESLKVTLPYSNDSFGVPSNLYIIGTMNTADRSIALLDTALRRRFEFVEMMPEWNNQNISTNCEGVNLQSLLKSINARIEFLLDREHTIGHSFFIGVDSMEDLREVFGLKIIPLLQEYFYDDYAKISAVLNHNGMIKAFSQGDLGVNLSDDFVDSQKRVYRISDSHSWDIETFIKIYQSNDSRESSDNE